MSLRSASGEHSAGFGPTALARLGALLLLLALLPLHVLAPFLHAHTEADPRATMQAGLHLPGLEALEDEALDGPACGLRHPPLIEEADLCRRHHADTDADEAIGPARDLRLIAAVPHIVPAADGVAPPEQPPPAPPARAPPRVSVDA